MNCKEMKEKLRIADEIARLLHSKHTDPNEVAACVTFLRDEEQAPYFFDYLKAVADEPNLARSRRTPVYYSDIHQVSQHYLKGYHQDLKAMAWILGWAARLMRYYQTGGKPFPRMRTGKVRFFHSGEYGFIIPDMGGKDV